MAKFLDMVNGQIRAAREVIGTTVAIAGRDEEFKIATFDLDKDGNLASVTVVAGEEDSEVSIKITEKNQEIAHYGFNPNERVALDASKIGFDAAEKELFWEANGVEYKANLGAYVVKRILGAFAGKIYLVVDDPADAAEQSVMIYDVQSDKFEGVLGFVSKLAKMYTLSDTEAYIVNNLLESKKVDEAADGQPIMQLCCTKADVLRVDGRGTGTSRIDLGEDLIISDIRKSNDERATLFIADKIFEGKKRVVKDLEKALVLIETCNNDTLVTVPTLTPDEISVFVGGKYNDIITVKTPGSLQIEGSNGTIVNTKDSAIVDGMDGFNIFCAQCKVFAEDGAQSTKLTYADAAYDNIKSLIVKTTDRGDVITLA